MAESSSFRNGGIGKVNIINSILVVSGNTGLENSLDIIVDCGYFGDLSVGDSTD